MPNIFVTRMDFSYGDKGLNISELIYFFVHYGKNSIITTEAEKDNSLPAISFG